MFLAAACGNAVHVYDIDGGTLREGRKICSNIEATCAVWNHNNRILVSAFANGLISINSLTSQRDATVFNLQEGSSGVDMRVNSLHLSAGSRYLISGGTDRAVRVWDLKRQQLKHAFSACNSAIRSVTFTGQTDEFIVAGCESGDIYLYHTQQGIAAGMCRDREDASAIQAVQSSTHPFVRNKLGTVQMSGTLRLWDITTASQTSSFPRLHWAPSTCIAFSPVHKHLVATGGLDKRVVFCDMGVQKEINCLESPYAVTTMSMHANGHLITTGTSTGHVLLYDLRGATKPLAIVEPCGAQAAAGAAMPSVQWIQFSQDRMKDGDASMASSSSASMKKAKSFHMQTLQTSLLNLVPSSASLDGASDDRLKSSLSTKGRSAALPLATLAGLSGAAPVGKLSDPLPSTSDPTPANLTAGEASSESIAWLRQELHDLRDGLSEQIQLVHLEVLRQHQTQQTELANAMHELKLQMAQLLAENQHLRRENERLKHIF
ncbi:hypothetical protein H310_14650 [Aphanomyces invadans]|uniref:DDB1- and CUL4-associated factor 12 beta-propeller domain-containing protein n=1 Tax=Aphanomyces invadans TaxID=157072 RepID=A0A024T8Y1_9STRA|nr:hypothetical protein H310_14650 [Aphanomyces invadans]ETV90615.1 hypothetical protein H310_14650 [Aphanomyces invadans]|eukprot:XP_008880768.1 hypothetical protein H310_14650 [Aphanomyces invadans]